MPRFSVCVPALFPRIPLEESLPKIKELGFDAWETWGLDLQRVEEIRMLNEGLGLTLAQFVGHTSLSDGLNKAENHKRIADELAQTIQAAKVLGCPGLICFSGNTLNGISEEQQIETIVTGLRAVVPMAEEVGINLNLELLNSKIDHAGYFNDTSRIGLEIVRRVGSPRVKLLYDIYHMQIMEGNLIATITQHIASIGHFHAAGVPGRHDLDDTQEINYRAVFRAIDRAGYSLFVGLEYWPVGDAVESLRRFRETYG